MASPKGMKRSRTIGIFAIVAAAVIVADQATKALIRANFAHTGDRMQVIPGAFDFILVHNEGAAFGMMQGGKVFFIAAASAVTVAALVYLCSTKHPSAYLATVFALIVGGAIGNGIDRIALGYVTDFIATAFIDFPVFNVADSCISIGCVLFVAWFVFSAPRHTQEDAEAPLGAGEAPEEASQPPHDA